MEHGYLRWKYQGKPDTFFYIQRDNMGLQGLGFFAETHFAFLVVKIRDNLTA